MANPESPPACNFPEILARDLELSEATFLARSMTAGTPIRSLATPTEERQPLYLAIDKQNSHVHWEDTLSKEGGLGVIDEASYLSDSSDNGTTSEVASLTSDSGTDSGPEMEPPSVRILRQSVCTAATSVTAHCLPSKEEPAYSLVALEDSYHGQSWIDLDMETSDDDEPGEAQTARPGQPTKHIPECAADSVRTLPPSSGSDKYSDRQGNGVLPACPPPLDRVLAALPSSSFSSERPRTSSGVPTQDKPRLVEIPRPFCSHKRSFSHDPSSRQLSRSLSEFQPDPSRSWTLTSSTLASRASGFQHEILGAETFPTSPSRETKQYQAIMSGQKVIDATPGRASRIAFAPDDEPPQDEIINEHNARQSHEDDHPAADISHDDDHLAADISHDDSVEADERMSGVKIPAQLLEEILSSPGQQEEAATPDPQEPPTDEPRSDSSDDSSIGETWYRSRVAVPETHIPSSSSNAITSQASMAIPPHIFEQLSTSVTSFGEMPLSPKSLTMDMIRSCSKKLRMKFDQSLLANALNEPDASTPPSPKWKLSSLRKKDTPPPSAPSAPTSSFLTHPSPEAAAMLKIFPRASKHHCESLYAYLVAYNYIGSLCGEDEFFKAFDPTSVASAIGTVSRLTRKTPRLMHHRTTNDDTTGVPDKAVTLLGMDASSSTAPGPSTRKLSKMRSFFRKGKGAGEMVVTEPEPANPAKSAASSSAAAAKARPARVVTEAEVKKLQAGLLQCVRNLVAKARAGSSTAEAGTLQTDDFEVDPEGWRTLDPYLLRALSEVVRAEEDRLASSTA
ncbi:hypothetical protein CONLIGDRAFT_680035 [Coniochaeta ligniaria NRRL 30616]|uniref:Uncharacterized protein n=1 Tax=Coniochaeta ligniaria NRRL 30616 TaxID=1408157 RepID=A0A1J7JPQ3_9PEZI|nr:hypothetical protein CONLIGDRAFT_680035 [Coniochaeta ligniaria NRRL 30616]